MNYSRRDLSFFLGALAASQAPAQNTALKSKAYRHEDLQTKINGQNASRAILKGETHTGYPIECHETELAAGQAPHPPHHHVREEMMFVREGTIEVTMAGETTTLGPGSVVFVASNLEHGWRNSGTTRAVYFVLALGGDA